MYNFDLNRLAWDYTNERIETFKGDYASAIRSGSPCLPNEIVKILAIKAGERLLHLMCNDGRELCFLSYLTGCAGDGVDFSEPAIHFAQDLNQQLGLANSFSCQEAHSWLRGQSEPKWSVGFLSLGSLRWIPDLAAFFSLVRSILKKPGRFLVWDFHPFALCLSDDGVLNADYPFGSQFALRDIGVRNYAESPERYRLLARQNIEPSMEYANPHQGWFASHSVASIINGGIVSGFTVDKILELNFSWEERYLSCLGDQGDRRFVSGGLVPQFPVTLVVNFVV